MALALFGLMTSTLRGLNKSTDLEICNQPDDRLQMQQMVETEVMFAISLVDLDGKFDRAA